MYFLPQAQVEKDIQREGHTVVYFFSFKELGLDVRLLSIERV